MEIPKGFKLFGQNIEVVIDNTLHNALDCKGIVSFSTNKIKLQCNKATDAPRERMEQVYLHEVVHLIFNELGYDKERDSEQMVDQIAHALHQITTTSVYHPIEKDQKNAKNK